MPIPLYNNAALARRFKRQSRQSRGHSERWTLWLCLALAAFTLGGCQILSTGDNKSPEVTTIASPPNIPTPPDAQNPDDPDSPQARLVYQDMIDLEKSILSSQKRVNEGEASQTENASIQQNQQLALVHAVQSAIARRILTPSPYRDHKPSYFKAEAPVLYEDFYVWALGFSKPSANHPLDLSQSFIEENASEQASESNSEAPTPPRPAGPPRFAGEPLAAAGITLPYSPPAGSGMPLSAQSTINRETLCMLYVRLSAQQEKASALSAEAIETANPGKSDVYGLSSFADGGQISPWAKKYVAIAYQDNLIRQVFGLRQTALVNGQGFQPQKALTRGEAMLFLYQFFSSRRTP